MPQPGSELAKDQQKKDEDLKAGIIGSGPDATAGKDESADKKGEQEEKKYTDSEVNALLDKKFADISAKLEKKYADQYEAKKKELTEAQKLEKMNDDEKAKYKNEQLEAEIAELKREKSLSEQMTVARRTLKEANIAISDELLSAFVTPDAETTKKAVDAFKEMYTRDLNAAVTDALKRTPPKADPPNPGKGKSAGALAAERHNAKYAIQTE